MLALNVPTARTAFHKKYNIPSGSLLVKGEALLLDTVINRLDNFAYILVLFKISIYNDAISSKI